MDSLNGIWIMTLGEVREVWDRPGGGVPSV
jgi:hypothetical protein